MNLFRLICCFLDRLWYVPCDAWMVSLARFFDFFPLSIVLVVEEAAIGSPLDEASGYTLIY